MKSAPQIVRAPRYLLLTVLMGLAVTLGSACSGDSLVNMPRASKPECTADGDCGDGQSCVEGTCTVADAYTADARSDVADAAPDVPHDTGPRACTSDGDCTAPQVCTFDMATGALVCADPVGPGAPGDACTAGADCASGICLEGSCAAPCGGESDCPSGQTCASRQVNGHPVDVCVDEQVPCDSNDACVDPQACVATRGASGSGVTWSCAAPTGAGQLGDACSVDGDCRSNLCLDGECTRPCARPADCGNDMTHICDQHTVNGADTQVCVPRPAQSCLADSECTAPELCMASRTATDVVWQCGLPAGGTTANPGEACTDDSECTHHFCFDGTCTEACTGANDCAVADASCEVTAVDLGGGNTDSSQICRPPVPCDRDAACRLGQVCYLRSSATPADLVCLGPNTGGAQLGALCSDGSDCAMNLCYPGRFFDYCAEACADNTDCNVAGYECKTVTVSGTGLSAGICVPSDPPACSSDADCASGTRCAIVADAGGSALQTACVPDFGGQDSGVACSTDLDCASLDCQQGFCAAPCSDTSQCSGVQVCGSKTVQKNGLTGDFDVCFVPDACSSDAACTTAGQRCVANKMTSTINFGCNTPNAGGAEMGASCNTDSDCAQNLCLNGQCVGPCATGQDCPSGQHYSCENTAVDLGGSVSATARLCIPPTDCVANSDCSGADVCYVDSSSASAGLYCATPNAGGGGLGQVCSSNSACSSNLCYPGRFRDICTVGCSSNADCTVAGYECRSTTIPQTNTTATLCVPSNPPACSQVSDCVPGTSCAIVPTVSGTGLESVCIPSTGGKGTGTACVQNTDCASQICLNGQCAAPCTATNQCAYGQLCHSTTVSNGGVSGSFQVCETLPDQTCSSTSDCTDGVRVCSQLRYVGNDRVPYCQFPQSGGAQLGGTCSKNTDCHELLCLGFASECTAVCSTDADCGANQACTTYDFPDNGGPRTTIGVCNTSCTHNADCGGSRVCTINADKINNQIDQVCWNPVGAGAIGDTCTGGGDCGTGLCLNTYSPTSQTCASNTDCPSGQVCRSTSQGNRCSTVTKNCTALCVSDTDCIGTTSNPLTSCSANTTVPKPNGGTTTISTCARP